MSLHLGDKGPNALALQQEINKTLERHGFDWRKVDTDGAAGHHTFSAARMAGWVQGLSGRQLRKIRDGEITGHAEAILTHQKRRSGAMKRREVERRPQAAKLRKHHNDKPPSPIGSFDGKDVAGWIVPWLEKSRQAGWTGTVTSGYRSPEYSESLCYAMCGAPSCPGRCAGKTSNHSGSVYPAGAVDVTDYYNFGSIQPRIGSPLKNALGSADPVHFSYTGH